MNTISKNEIQKAIEHIQTPLIIEFLTKNQWQKIDEWEKPVSIWQANNHEQTQILLPESNVFKDYATSLWQALNVIAKVSQISLPNLIETVSGKDILKIRVMGEDVQKGHIPLADGKKLFSGIADLVENTVCKAIRQLKKPHNITRQAIIQNYLNQIELGQTEIGSYAVNVITPALNLPDGLWVDKHFIQQTLFNGLHEFLLCINEMENDNDILPFLKFTESKQHLVNGKFCQALLNMSSKQRDVEISFFNSSSSSQTSPMPPIVIQHNQWQFIHTAQRFFKGEEFMLKNRLIVGEVTDLHREPTTNPINGKPNDDLQWRITVLSIVHQKLRRISIALNEADYKKALMAHNEKEQIQCRGDLLITPKRARLENLQQFDILTQGKLI